VRTAQLQLRAQGLRRHVDASHLDVERAHLVLCNQAIESLQVQGRNLEKLKSGQKRARNQVLCGQVVNAVGNAA